MRRVFPVIHLLLITALAFQGVSLFYGIVGLQIDRVGDFKPASGGNAAPKAQMVRPLSHYQTIASRNLFKLAAADKTASAAGEAKTVNTEEIERTDLNLKLWGTVIGGDPANSYAVIEDQKSKTQELYAIGDSIVNTQAVVRRILNKTVIIRLNDTDQKLEMEEFAGAAGANTPGVSTASLPSMSFSGGPSPSSPQTIHVARSQIDSALGDINNLMQQVNIRPHFEDGKPAGLMLNRVNPNSIFRRMGLRNGDVIVGVEGQQIESVDDALKFYESLKDSDAVSLDIKRSGQLKNIQYQIKE